MRIAQVAPPFESVPPPHYGGTERVIALLTDTLVSRGHEVTLFASGDSRTVARLRPVVARALWHAEQQYEDDRAFCVLVLGQLARALHEFDVVHSHLDFFAFPLARLAPCPVVTTPHGRLDLAELQPLYQEFSDVPLVSISDAQREPVPHANWVATIYHGLPLEEFIFTPHQGSYLAFLGRISPEKGLDTAIRVARRAGWPIKVAARQPLEGALDPWAQRDWDYYEHKVKPLLDEPHVELVGEVAGREKVEFLANAAALLFPICWPEPFGLVMPEALACGTPVLAFRHGSVPEILEHGATGFICTTEDDMVEAVGRIGELDRRRCRAEAERRFSAETMAAHYEQVYTRLVGQA